MIISPNFILLFTILFLFIYEQCSQHNMLTVPVQHVFWKGMDNKFQQKIAQFLLYLWEILSEVTIEILGFWTVYLQTWLKSLLEFLHHDSILSTLVHFTTVLYMPDSYHHNKHIRDQNVLIQSQQKITHQNISK